MSQPARWFVWRARRNGYVEIGAFLGVDADEAVSRAVDHEISKLPVKECSGMYFACPETQIKRIDYAVSYEKRNVSNSSTGSQSV